MDNSTDVFIASLVRHFHIVETCKSLLCNPEVKSITITANLYTDDEFRELQQRLLNINTITQIPIYLHRGNNEKKSNSKLQYIDKGQGKYILIFDDDLTVSPDYLQYLISGCEKYQAAVGLHGIILHQRPINSYYANRHVLRGLGVVDKDYAVDVISNCGHLFKREWHDDLSQWYDRCNNVSMDDLWVSLWHKQKGIQRVCLAHDTHYLKHKVQLPDETYVFTEYTKQLGVTDKVQTDFINNNFL